MQSSLNSESHKLCLITMMLGACVMGGTALFAKLIELEVVSIIFWRSVVALVVVGVAFALNKNRTNLLESPKTTLIVFLTGLALGAHWLTYFHSIKTSTVAIGAISMHTYPIFTVLFEPLVHKSKLSGRDVLLAAAVFLGCLILTLGPTDGGSTLWGVVWGVISAFLFSVRNIITRIFVSGFGAIAVMLVQLIGVLVIVAISSPFISGIETDFSLDKAYLLVLLGVFFTALPHSLVIFSLKGLSAKTMSIIGCTQPLFACLFAYLVLSEVPGINVYLGGGIILAVIFFELRAIRR